MPTMKQWRDIAREAQQKRMAPSVAAQHLLDSVGMGRVDDLVWLSDIAERIDVEIKDWPREEAKGYSGKLEIVDGHAVASARLGDAWVRRRFTLAHEFGHLMLHVQPDAQSGVQFRDDFQRVTPTEAQANQFAAALLIPEWRIRAFTAHFPTYVPPMHEMLRSFGVSDAAFRWRLRELGLSGLVLG